MTGPRRIGRFTAPAQWIQEFRTELKRVMGQCIVFRADFLLHENRIQYWAMSEHFRAVAEGDVIPEYRWIFSETDGLGAEEVVVPDVQSPPRVKWPRGQGARVLHAGDPYCPRCGHNRDASSVSSVDAGDGVQFCQLCGAPWFEVTVIRRARPATDGAQR